MSTTVSGMTNADVASKEGSDISSFAVMLDQLIKQRYEIMSKPIKDREIKVY